MCLSFKKNYSPPPLVCHLDPTARDSSMFGFFMQELLAKLGIPLVVGFCYVSLVCYQVAPYYLD
jgi:hypothetical protein